MKKNNLILRLTFVCIISLSSITKALNAQSVDIDDLRDKADKCLTGKQRIFGIIPGTSVFYDKGSTINLIVEFKLKAVSNPTELELTISERPMLGSEPEPKYGKLIQRIKENSVVYSGLIYTKKYSIDVPEYNYRSGFGDMKLYLDLVLKGKDSKFCFEKFFVSSTTKKLLSQ